MDVAVTAIAAKNQHHRNERKKTQQNLTFYNVFYSKLNIK